MEEMVASIKAEAMLEARRIDEETRAELDRINAETARLVAAERERLNAQARLREEELLRHLEAKQQLEARQRTLACKHALIDEIFALARSALEQMGDGQRRVILQRLWERASAQMSIAHVIAARRDAGFFRQKREKKVTVTAVEGLGGFIAESQDRAIRVDMRFESLLAEIRQHRIAEVSTVLFSEGSEQESRLGNRKSRKDSRSLRAKPGKAIPARKTIPVRARVQRRRGIKA
jgi:vacuolar-type H+-ATPase subunit E/Vma4